MSQTSQVLKALRILDLEEMLKLSQVLHVKQVPLKKAAGEELIVWQEQVKKPQKKEEPEASVLEFPKERSFSKDFSSERHHEAPSSGLVINLRSSESEEVKAEKDGPEKFLYSTEMLLWQRELTKDSEGLNKKDAVTGYKKATAMYVVKSQDQEGKEKIRFASTNGVLVNKKQA